MLNYRAIRPDMPRFYIIGFYPYPETNKTTERIAQQMYNSIAYTYDANIQLVYHPDEVINLPDLPIYVMEEPGKNTTDIATFEHPRDAIYMMGNSHYSHLSNYFNFDKRISLRVPGYNQPLYGCQVAAIIGHDRVYKGL